MTTIAPARVKREFKEVTQSTDDKDVSRFTLFDPFSQMRIYLFQPIRFIKLEMVESNFLHLKGEIFGPPETPYEGGKFKLDITVPESYPFNPPKVRFWFDGQQLIGELKAGLFVRLSLRPKSGTLISVVWLVRFVWTFWKTSGLLPWPWGQCFSPYRPYSHRQNPTTRKMLSWLIK